MNEIISPEEKAKKGRNNAIALGIGLLIMVIFITSIVKFVVNR